MVPDFHGNLLLVYIYMIYKGNFRVFVRHRVLGTKKNGSNKVCGKVRYHRYHFEMEAPLAALPACKITGGWQGWANQSETTKGMTWQVLNRHATARRRSESNFGSLAVWVRFQVASMARKSLQMGWLADVTDWTLYSINLSKS